MNLHEKALIACASDGNEFQPDDSYVELRGETIRAFVLGLKLSGISGGHTLTSLGVRIRGKRDERGKSNIKINGLSLRDGRAAGGEALPPLIITDCDFTDRIDISYSHLSRLTLRGCRFQRLDAEESRIDGHCDLSQVVARAEKNRAAIMFEYCNIGGRLILDEARVHGPEKDFAVDLQGSTIRDGISIIRGKIYGGLNIRDCLVEKSIRIEGVVLTSGPNDRAIDAHSARILGDFLIRRHDSTDLNARRSNRVRGSITLESSYVGGFLIIREGIFFATHLRNPNTRWHEVLRLDVATIAGSVVLGNADSRREDLPRTIGAGVISMISTRIEGSLVIRKISTLANTSRRLSPRYFFELKSRGMTIGKRLRMEDAHFRTREPSPRLTNAAVDLWRVSVGLGVSIEKDNSFDGSVRLNNAVVGRELIIHAGIGERASGEFSFIPTRLDLDDIKVAGPVIIGHESWESEPAEMWGSISLRACEIAGRLELKNIAFRYRALRDAESLLRLRMTNERVCIDLLSAKLNGGLFVRNLSWEPDADGRKEMLERGEIVVDLRGLSTTYLNDLHGLAWGFDNRALLRADRLTIGRIDEREVRRSSSDKNSGDSLWRDMESGDDDRSQNETAKARARRTFLWRQGWNARVSDGRWHSEDFSPQPFNEIARAHYAVGEDRVARDIVYDRISIQMQKIRRRLRRTPARWSPRAYETPGPDLSPIRLRWLRLLRWIGRGFLLAFLLGPFLFLGLWYLGYLTTGNVRAWSFVLLWWEYLIFFAYVLFELLLRVGFGYGLKPLRAVITCLVCIGIGTIGIDWARTDLPFWQARETIVLPDGRLRTEPPLIRRVEPVPALAEAHAAPNYPSGLPVAPVVEAEKLPCGEEAHSALIAVDLFIPLIDLGQEDLCVIRSDDRPFDWRDELWPWRLVRSAYEILGWLVISMTIITLTGVIRRDVER